MNPTKKKSVLERFYDRVNKDRYAPCWDWFGPIHPITGYGQLTVDKKTISAHILSWRLFRGEVPEGKWVRHTCSMKRCVNPEHLYLGDRTRKYKESLFAQQLTNENGQRGTDGELRLPKKDTV